jgi:DnaJ-class molecular chaperone
MSLEHFGLDSSATHKELKEAYHRKALEVHPDKGGTPEDFIALRKLYEKAKKKIQPGADATKCFNCEGGKVTVHRGFQTMLKMCRVCNGKGKV